MDFQDGDSMAPYSLIIEWHWADIVLLVAMDLLTSVQILSAYTIETGRVMRPPLHPLEVY